MTSLGSSDVPSAVRAAAPTWRDPRLWIGVALVAVSVVAGAQLLRAADDTVAVWAAGDDLAVGTTLDPDDLEARRVRFADEADLSRYLAVADPLPAELGVLRGVGAGELVPRAALGGDDGAGQVRVSVAVPPTGVVPGVEPGDEVDVYVVPQAGSQETDVELLVGGAVVLEAPSVADELGSVAGERQLVLGVPEEAADTVGPLLAAASSGRIAVAFP